VRNCKRNNSKHLGNTLDTFARDTERVMNWLLPRHRDQQERILAGAPARPEAPQRPDPYRDVALGVECAWPVAIEREVMPTHS
jgi:hypothetical protein